MWNIKVVRLVFGNIQTHGKQGKQRQTVLHWRHIKSTQRQRKKKGRD